MSPAPASILRIRVRGRWGKESPRHGGSFTEQKEGLLPGRAGRGGWGQRSPAGPGPGGLGAFSGQQPLVTVFPLVSLGAFLCKAVMPGPGGHGALS